MRQQRQAFRPHYLTHRDFVEGCDGCKSFRDWKNARNSSWTKPAARMQEVTREQLIAERALLRGLKNLG